jgi:PAS domain S-box-containing protein
MNGQDRNRYIESAQAVFTLAEKGKKAPDARRIGLDLCSEAIGAIKRFPLSCLVVFSSASFDLKALLSGIHDGLKGQEVPVIGTTTAGEICSAPLERSVVLLALASPYLSVHTALGRDVSKDWQRATEEVASSRQLFNYFTGDPGLMTELQRQGQRIFGLLFTPGNTRHADSRSYEIMEHMKQLSRGRFPIFGGASADDWKMEKNCVLLGQEVYEDSLLLAIFETELRFGMGMAHGFLPTDKRAVVTKVKDHVVLELDGRPAASRYAELLGYPEDDLKGKHITLTTGKLAGIPIRFNDYAINVSSFFTESGGVRFAQPMREGMQITIMEAAQSDLIAAGIMAIQDGLLRGEISRPAVSLIFSCAIRQRLLGGRSQEEIMTATSLLPGASAVGFYSFGEQGITRSGENLHNNGAITTLVIADELTGAALTALENKKLISNLKFHIEELKEARNEISRLNTFLRAIRNVNQAIVKQKAVKPLLKEICLQFSREDIFDGAVILLLDDQGRISELVWNGTGTDTKEMAQQINRGIEPSCLNRLRKGRDITPYFRSGDQQVPDECHKCSLKANGKCPGLIAAPITYKEHLYGGLLFIHPKIGELDTQWRHLIEEICGDIGYGIHFIHLLHENARVQKRLEQLTLAIEHSADLIMITDRDGVILYVNPAFERISGFSKQEVLGARPNILKSGKHSDRFYKELWETILSGEVWRGEITNRKKDGTLFVQESTISPIKDKESGQVVGFVAVMRDVTEKKQLEEQLRKAQKLEAIGTLAAGIAHDFNNILTSIIGHGELCRLHLSDNKEAVENIEQIIQAGLRARDLVKQILTYARKSPEEKRIINVTPLIKETASFMQASLPPSIEIRYSIDTDDDRILADSSKIYQVILNLCTNAAQAMKEKGGVLEITLEKRPPTGTELLANPSMCYQDYVVITIRDTGCGIPENLMDRIFDPYFTTREADEGTGLGLAVVQGIVQGHGGFITVESKLEEGSTFRVFIPAASDKEDEQKGTKEEARSVTTGHILLAEDEPAILDLVSVILEHLGYMVTPARDGKEALELFKKAPDTFDLVITDLEMPGMGGDELALEISALRPELPIVIATGYNELRKTGSLQSGKVRKIIMKPFTIEDLKRELREVLWRDKE